MFVVGRSSRVNRAVQVISTGVRRPEQRARRAVLTSSAIYFDINNHMIYWLSFYKHSCIISRELYALIKRIREQWVPCPFSDFSNGPGYAATMQHMSEHNTCSLEICLNTLHAACMCRTHWQQLSLCDCAVHF